MLQCPNDGACHRDVEHPARDHFANVLLPTFQLLAVAFEQPKETFDPPTSVIPKRDPLAQHYVFPNIAKQGPLRDDVTLLVNQTGDYQTRGKRAADHVVLFSVWNARSRPFSDAFASAQTAYHREH